MKNWRYLFKDRKACYELVQKTKTNKSCSVGGGKKMNASRAIMAMYPVSSGTSHSQKL